MQTIIYQQKIRHVPLSTQNKTWVEVQLEAAAQLDAIT